MRLRAYWGALVLCASCSSKEAPPPAAPPSPAAACMGDGTRVHAEGNSPDAAWARSLEPLTHEEHSAKVEWSCSPTGKCQNRGADTLQVSVRPRDQETCAIYDCGDVSFKKNQPLAVRAKTCPRSLAREVAITLRSADGAIRFETEGRLISRAPGSAKVTASVSAGLPTEPPPDPELAARLGVDPSLRVQQIAELQVTDKGTRGRVNLSLIDPQPAPGQWVGTGGFEGTWTASR